MGTERFLEIQVGKPSLFTLYICILCIGLPWWISGKEFCTARDAGLIPGLGRSFGEGNGNPLQFSCPGNPWTEEPGGLQSIGIAKESSTAWQLHTHTHTHTQTLHSMKLFFFFFLVKKWIVSVKVFQFYHDVQYSSRSTFVRSKEVDMWKITYSNKVPAQAQQTLLNTVPFLTCAALNTIII